MMAVTCIVDLPNELITSILAEVMSFSQKVLPCTHSLSVMRGRWPSHNLAFGIELCLKADA